MPNLPKQHPVTLSGAFTLELAQLDRLADLVAERVAALLRQPTGQTYERSADPGAGPVRGRTGFGAVVDDLAATDVHGGWR